MNQSCLPPANNPIVFFYRDVLKENSFLLMQNIQNDKLSLPGTSKDKSNMKTAEDIQGEPQQHKRMKIKHEK